MASSCQHGGPNKGNRESSSVDPQRFYDKIERKQSNAEEEEWGKNRPGRNSGRRRPYNRFPPTVSFEEKSSIRANESIFGSPSTTDTDRGTSPEEVLQQTFRMPPRDPQLRKKARLFRLTLLCIGAGMGYQFPFFTLFLIMAFVFWKIRV